jgi:hypothetical protein
MRMFPLHRQQGSAGQGRMEERIEELKAELVDLLQRQIEALELEVYVGLTEGERREYSKRQGRMRELDAEISRSLDSAA